MEVLENGCLKILLTEEDLYGFGLTFDNLDYDDNTTRDVLQMLLIAARNETGFDPAGGVVVEALPVDGGCLLLVTPTGGHRRIRMKRAVGPYVYEFDDADQLLGLASSISRYRRPEGGKTSPVAGSSLYQFDGRYRLVLYPAAPMPRGVGNLLQEFARAAGEGDAAAAYTAEHGRPIAVGDALARMCEAAAR